MRNTVAVLSDDSHSCLNSLRLSRLAAVLETQMNLYKKSFSQPNEQANYINIKHCRVIAEFRKAHQSIQEHSYGQKPSTNKGINEKRRALASNSTHTIIIHLYIS